MASQVLSGSSNPSYTNNTGQNVRVVINYMASSVTSSYTPSWLTSPAFTTTTHSISINWAGVSANAGNTSTVGANSVFAIGRNLATNSFYTSSSPTSIVASNSGQSLGVNFSFALPTELMLAPGQTFSATCGVYNIVIIPEAG